MWSSEGWRLPTPESRYLLSEGGGFVTVIRFYWHRARSANRLYPPSDKTPVIACRKPPRRLRGRLKHDSAPTP